MTRATTVTVTFEIEVSDAERRAVRRSQGKSGRATIAELTSLAQLGMQNELDAAMQSCLPRPRSQR